MAKPGYRQTVLIFLLLVLVPLGGCSRSEQTLNFKAQTTLQRLHAAHPATFRQIDEAFGVLVFPTITTFGFGFGFQVGEGVLVIKGQPKVHFRLVGAGAGMKFGVKTNSHVSLFMSDAVLRNFILSSRWKHGIESSVVIGHHSLGGLTDSHNLLENIQSYLFNARGFMFNLSYDVIKINQVTKNL